jgi:hypothetical protein
VMRGGALPEPSEAITHEAPEFHPLPPDEAARRLAALKRELGAVDAEPTPPPASPYRLADVEAQLQQHYGSAQP